MAMVSSQLDLGVGREVLSDTPVEGAVHFAQHGRPRLVGRGFAVDGRVNLRKGDCPEGAGSSKSREPRPGQFDEDADSLVDLQLGRGFQC